MAQLLRSAWIFPSILRLLELEEKHVLQVNGAPGLSATTVAEHSTRSVASGITQEMLEDFEFPVQCPAVQLISVSFSNETTVTLSDKWSSIPAKLSSLCVEELCKHRANSTIHKFIGAILFLESYHFVMLHSPNKLPEITLVVNKIKFNGGDDNGRFGMPVPVNKQALMLPAFLYYTPAEISIHMHKMQHDGCVSEMEQCTDVIKAAMSSTDLIYKQENLLRHVVKLCQEVLSSKTSETRDVVDQTPNDSTTNNQPQDNNKSQHNDSGMTDCVIGTEIENVNLLNSQQESETSNMTIGYTTQQQIQENSTLETPQSNENSPWKEAFGSPEQFVEVNRVVPDSVESSSASTISEAPDLDLMQHDVNWNEPVVSKDSFKMYPSPQHKYNQQSSDNEQRSDSGLEILNNIISMVQHRLDVAALADQSNSDLDKDDGLFLQWLQQRVSKVERMNRTKCTHRPNATIETSQSNCETCSKVLFRTVNAELDLVSFELLSRQAQRFHLDCQAPDTPLNKEIAEWFCNILKVGAVKVEHSRVASAQESPLYQEFLVKRIVRLQAIHNTPGNSRGMLSDWEVKYLQKLSKEQLLLSVRGTQRESSSMSIDPSKFRKYLIRLRNRLLKHGFPSCDCRHCSRSFDFHCSLISDRAFIVYSEVIIEQYVLTADEVLALNDTATTETTSSHVAAQNSVAKQRNSTNAVNESKVGSPRTSGFVAWAQSIFPKRQRHSLVP